MKYSLFFFLTVSVLFTAAQQNVGIGTTTPDSSAALDVSSSNRGMLIPRLSTVQRTAINNPAAGLLVFDTDKGAVMFFDGTSWRAMSFTDENKTDPQSRSSSEPSYNAGFGTRVSISGDYAIIGAPRYNGSGLANMGLVYIFNKTAGGWKQVARLAAIDSASNDLFGESVAISGDYAIAGSTGKAVGTNLRQGKVYVYHRIGSAWLLDTAFIKPTGSTNEFFGWSVGVCAFNSGGPAIAVGIPYSNTAEHYRGEVYFYRKAGNTWSLIQNMVPADLANFDVYGSTIAMDTDYVAIAAPAQVNGAGNMAAGAVYIYAFGGGVWNLQQKIQGFTTYGRFGSALSLSSNKLAIGAPFAIGNANTSSVVYVYSRTGSAWTELTSLYINNFEIVPNATSSVSIVNLTFGMSVSLAGNTLLVGASGGIEFPDGTPSGYGVTVGSVYVYKNYLGDTFARTNLLHSDFPVNGDFFGESVSISGSNYIIGSPRAIVNGVVNAGDVYFGN